MCGGAPIREFNARIDAGDKLWQKSYAFKPSQWFMLLQWERFKILTDRNPSCHLNYPPAATAEPSKSPNIDEVGKSGYSWACLVVSGNIRDLLECVRPNSGKTSTHIRPRKNITLNIILNVASCLFSCIPCTFYLFIYLFLSIGKKKSLRKKGQGTRTSHTI